MSERHDHSRNYIGKVRIELCAKSFILQVYDVLARHNSNCAGPFSLTNFRATCCVTAMRSLAMNFENRCEAWASAKFCLHRAHLGREPMAYVERVIGSVRRECLDHVIVFHESSLRRILTSYFDYYHRSTTHLSSGKDSPEPRAIQPPEMGPVVVVPQVGGLHHRYERRAA
jgi:hypothetical protein